METQQNNNPGNTKVAIYVRPVVAQSLVYQQREILLALAQSIGWRDEQITVYEEQPGLIALFESLQEGNVHTLVVADRLFRDGASIEGTQFIRLCEMFGVTVITPHNTYDFSQRCDVMRFRMESDAAAELLRFAVERLQKRRALAAQRGLYDGRPLAPGYIVDRQRLLSGQPNPTYKKLIAYPPHAEIISNLFCQYVQCNGDMSKLIAQLPCVPVPFPDFTEGVDERSIAKTTLRKVAVGYVLPLAALKHLLYDPTPAYIGTWVYKDVELIHNHEPIVPEDIFRKAQELSRRKEHSSDEDTLAQQ